MVEYGDLRLPDRFWSAVYPEPNTGCWLWGRFTNRRGYGQFKKDGHTLAHRVAYSALVGEIPDGHHVDHLCRVRWCVNPEHLEAVTQAVNNQRAAAFDHHNRRKTHCPQRHEYSAKNTYINPATGRRRCRTCDTAQGRRARLRRC